MITTERKKCTKENPCNSKGRWYHPDAKILEDNDEIYTDWYKCPNCNITFGERVGD